MPHKQRILIAEDDRLQRSVMAIHLRRHGYRVTCAANGVEAFEKARHEGPYLILSGVLMSPIDGYALARCIRADRHLCHIPVVLIASEQITESDRGLAKTMGASAILQRTPDCSNLLVLLELHFAGVQPLPVEPLDTQGDTTYTALFLVEGQRDCRRIARDLQQAHEGAREFDFARASDIVRRWAATAETVAHGEIGAEAFRLDMLLNASPSPALKPVAEAVERLLMLFVAAANPEGSSSLPAPARQVLSNKNFALLGFEDREAEELSTFFSTIPAFASVLPAETAQPNHPALRGFHAVILKDGRLEKPLEPYAASQSARPALLTSGSEPLEIALRTYALLAAPDPFAGRANSDRRDLTVLIADGDSVITEALHSACSQLSLECFRASDGVVALTLARRVRPDITLLDVNMPHLGGFEVLFYLKQDRNTRDLKTVLFSARQFESDVQRAIRLGADAYITKPCNPFALAQRLRQLAEERLSCPTAG